MNNKVTLKKIAESASIVAGSDTTTTQEFVKTLFAKVAELIQQGNTVELDGIGTFQPCPNGESPIVFLPATDVADALNAPFAMFTAVELDDGVSQTALDSIDHEEVTTSEETDSESLPEPKPEPHPEPIPEPETEQQPEPEIAPVVEAVTPLPIEVEADADVETEADYEDDEEPEPSITTIPEDEEEYVDEDSYEEPAPPSRRFWPGFFTGVFVGLLMGVVMWALYVIYYINEGKQLF